MTKGLPPRGENDSRDYSIPFRIAGSHGSTVSSADTIEDLESIRPIVDILLAAAWSDGAFCEFERGMLVRLLEQLLQARTLPSAIQARMDAFQPEAFDLSSAVHEYQERSNTSDRRLMELVRKICDADGSLGLREEQFMKALSLSLSLPPRRIGDLVVNESTGVNGRFKRAEDLVLGTVFLCLAAFPMACVALAIKLTSPGPVFFRQRRYGRAGAEIKVFKFRTMRVLEDGSAVQQAKKGDSRITPVGRFLRATSLDELPQLFNVLRGEMSLIGPRPHAVAHNELYRKQIVEYMLRHKVKPGITGWAQVNGWRGETDTLRKMVYRVEHDLYYIRNWSPWLDLKILWLTVFGRKVRENAY